MTYIKQLDSRIVYRNKWMSVREDRILRPSGNEGILGVVDKPDFVVIVDSEGEDLITHRVSLRNVENMLADGTIKDATTLAAYSLTKLKGLILIS